MRAGAGTRPPMSSSSGDDREARLQGRALGIRQLGWEAGCSGRWSQPGEGDGPDPSAMAIIPSPPPPPPTVRCELSIEKSTVLQSELKSCKELQELEPENKCEAMFPEILLLSGSPFLCLLGGQGAGRVSIVWEQP